MLCVRVWPNTCCGKQRKSGRQEGGGDSRLVGYDNEYVFRDMMWADNHWLFSGSKEELRCMVNDIIEELLDLDIEPEPVSL